MNILGIDYGHKRVGLAYADTDIGVAVPIPAAVESAHEDRLSHIGREISARRIDKIVIGYPFNMDGSVGYKAREVDDYIKILEDRFGLPVERADERLSSFQAEQDAAVPVRDFAQEQVARVVEAVFDETLHFGCIHAHIIAIFAQN